MENPGINNNTFTLFFNEDYYMEERPYYKPKIKVTLTLKPELRVESGFKMHYMDEEKFVPDNRVSFYTDSVLIALQAFRMNEVLQYTIEGYT